MGSLERLDQVLEEFEGSAKEIGKIKIIIQEISKANQEINKNTGSLKVYNDEIVRIVNKAEENEKKLEQYLDKENNRREEFISSVKSILVKMNNENMDLYQNLSDSMKGNIETTKTELVNVILNENSNIKKELHSAVGDSANQLKSYLSSEIDNLVSEVIKCREDFKIKFKFLKYMLFAIFSGVTIVLLLFIIGQ